MKKYLCPDCGTIFDEENSGSKSEKVVEFWGAPAYKEYVACPQCGETELDRLEETEEE